MRFWFAVVSLQLVLLISGCSQDLAEDFPVSVVNAENKTPEKAASAFIDQRFSILEKSAGEYGDYLQKIQNRLDIPDRAFEMGHIQWSELEIPTLEIVDAYIAHQDGMSPERSRALREKAVKAERAYREAVEVTVKGLKSPLLRRQVREDRYGMQYRGAYGAGLLIDSLKDEDLLQIVTEIRRTMLAADRSVLWKSYSSLRYSYIADYRAKRNEPSIANLVTKAITGYMEKQAPADWKSRPQWVVFNGVLEQGFLSYPFLSVFAELQESGVNGYLGDSRLGGLDSQIRQVLKQAGKADI